MLISFDSEEFMMDTTLGFLHIKGSSLEIIKLDTYQGNVSIKGKIDSITYNRIVKIGFNNLTEFQKEKVTKAICLEADDIYAHGFNDEDNNDILSYSVLDISVNVKDSSSKETRASKLHMSEEAYDLIHKTGLNCPIL